MYVIQDMAEEVIMQEQKQTQFIVFRNIIAVLTNYLGLAILV